MDNQLKRVFIAVNLPKEVKDELERLSHEIKDSFPEELGAKVGHWVNIENAHITLLFLGDIKAEKIPQLVQSVKSAVSGWQEFSVKLQRVCYGPRDVSVPRLVWVESAENKDLECLAQTIEETLLKQKIINYVENRPFSAHVTLARLNALVFRSIDLEERPQVDQEIDLGFKVQSVDVMESVLKRSGPEYKILQAIKLDA